MVKGEIRHERIFGWQNYKCMKRQITKELLEEDSRIYEELMYHWNRYKLYENAESKTKYRELEYAYYVENDDVRMYYKTQ